MQTIIAYNEKEVKEQTGFENLNSKDKAWIDLLVTPERKAELALLPHPTDSRNGRLWGSTLYGPHWKPE